MSAQLLERTMPPSWALQRVSTVLDREGASERVDPKRVAQKAGISKSLARHCMAHLNSQRNP